MLRDRACGYAFKLREHDSRDLSLIKRVEAQGGELLNDGAPSC